MSKMTPMKSSLAKRSNTARPIPDAAPVTTAILFIASSLGLGPILRAEAASRAGAAVSRLWLGAGITRDPKPETRNSRAQERAPSCQAGSAQLKSPSLLRLVKNSFEGGCIMADKAIEVLLDEKRNFLPPEKFKKSANVRSASVFNTERKNKTAI